MALGLCPVVQPRPARRGSGPPWSRSSGIAGLAFSLLLFGPGAVAGAGDSGGARAAAGAGDETPGGRILEAVRRYARGGVRYDASYVRLRYPGGAVPKGRGACTDLVVAGLREVGIDLQAELQRDIERAPEEYRRPLRHYGAPQPDPSIDHRRVANLEVYFRRHLVSLPVAAEEWAPGDLVVWDQDRDGWADHVGVVSDRRGERLPLVYHNYPRRGHHPGVAFEGDCMQDWKRVGHYRVERGGAP